MRQHSHHHHHPHLRCCCCCCCLWSLHTSRPTVIGSINSTNHSNQCEDERRGWSAHSPRSCRTRHTVTSATIAVRCYYIRQMSPPRCSSPSMYCLRLCAALRRSFVVRGNHFPACCCPVQYSTCCTVL